MADIPDKPNYTHGSTGTSPATALDYEDGDPVDSENFDYFINITLERIKTLIDVLNELDDDDDSVVNAADTAALYKGNDIDSNGDGVVDESEDTNLYKGEDIDSDGDGKVDEAEDADDATNVTSTYKGNDIDTDGDGKVNEAEQADNATTVNTFRVTVSDTEPSTRNDNDIWVDTS